MKNIIKRISFIGFLIQVGWANENLGGSDNLSLEPVEVVSEGGNILNLNALVEENTKEVKVEGVPEINGIDPEDLQMIFEMRKEEKREILARRKNTIKKAEEDIEFKELEIKILEQMGDSVESVSELVGETEEDLQEVLNEIEKRIEKNTESYKDLGFYIEETQKDYDEKVTALSKTLSALIRSKMDREQSINEMIVSNNDRVAETKKRIRANIVRVKNRAEANAKYLAHQKEQRAIYTAHYKAEQERLAKQAAEFKRRDTKGYQKVMEVFEQTRVLDEIRAQEAAIDEEFSNLEKKKLLAGNRAMHEDLAGMKTLLMQMYEAARVQLYAQEELSRDFVTVKAMPILEGIAKGITNRSMIRKDKEQKAESEATMLMRQILAVIKQTQDNNEGKLKPPVNIEETIRAAVKETLEYTTLDKRAAKMGRSTNVDYSNKNADTIDLLMRLDQTPVLQKRRPRLRSIDSIMGQRTDLFPAEELSEDPLYHMEVDQSRSIRSEGWESDFILEMPVDEILRNNSEI